MPPTIDHLVDQVRTPLADLDSPAARAVIDRARAHRYADPFARSNLAVMGEGDELQGHFDRT